MNLYYKIVTGWNAEDYIEITSDELEKAYYAFLTKKDAIYSGGAVRGSSIEKILPDYHRTMGWNRGYKLETVDFEDLADKRIDEKMRDIDIKAKNRVDYLIKTNQIDLIGKNVEIPELDSQQDTELKKITNELADKFKV